MRNGTSPGHAFGWAGHGEPREGGLPAMLTDSRPCDVQSTTRIPVAVLCTPGAIIILLYMFIDLFIHTGLLFRQNNGNILSSS